MPRRRVTPAPASASLTGLLLAATLAVAPPASAAPAAEVPSEDQPRVDRTFSVATLNVLGSNHTEGRDHRRTKRTARLIRRQHLKLVALQEVQADQLRGLRKRLPHYRFWPATTLGPSGLRLQIAWRPARFDLVDHGTLTTTFSYRERPVPWVRLRDEATGRRLFVIDIHNSPRDQEADRDSATRKEIRLFNRLSRRIGPVLLLGDANERREWFCWVSRRTGAWAATGGSVTEDSCSPPPHMSVDWMMGKGRFGWRDYRAEPVKVSDHRLHRATFRWRPL
ncbi:endonuclease/exonuclease/phosphatase family protein [Nocardioides sp.]|uniref:endonuclease/exonuclease/phosphatase family protein n=1 Tax=Nocardioides sp. TaxID=35761 RepID=UPI002ED5CCE7